MQPRGNDFRGLVGCIVIKPGENSVGGGGQIEGNSKAKEVENSSSIDLIRPRRWVRKLPNLRQMLLHKFLDSEWLFGLL